MKEKKSIRSKWLTIRLSEAEEAKLLQLYQSTTAQGLSEYARTVLLQKPVTVIYRNASADDFLDQMVGLKTELKAIGNNFNQVVHQLHRLNHFSEIRAWVILNEASRRTLEKKTAEILEKLAQIYTLWSQK